MLLPKPHLSFTLPSIHDNTKLQCRIYHPSCLLLQQHRQQENSPHEHNADAVNGDGEEEWNGVQRQGQEKWQGHAAVVAHPYAPLGGCYDDPVVDVVAGTLLQLGFVVATFNFRGAAPSEGRTSWTAKPEQGDYISVIGFLAYYVYHLLSSPSSSIPPPRQQPPVMCLAGYSYGAMITTRIPPLEEILAYFATPLIHSAEADVRLRAQHLAEVQNALLSSEDAASPRRSQGMRFGEGDSRKRMRRSTSSSFGALGGFHQQQQQKEERIQKSVKDLLVRAKRVRVHAHRENRYPRSSNQSQDRSESNTSSNNNNEGKETGREDGNKEHAEEECLHPVERGVTFRSAYIAVSPPVGLMTRLATMSFSFSNPFYSLSSSSPTSTSNSPSSSISSSLSSWLKRPQTQTQTTTTTQHQHAMTVTDYESKLTTSPTMVIYGDQDGFINQRRIREWTRQLSQTRIQTQREQEGNNVQRQASQFRYVEVTGTGHFWVEGDSIYKLRDAIGIFATELTRRTG